jgi:hypothetical protein
LNFIPHHVAFAAWMRRHVIDHRHRPEVITQNAWPQMRWDRWVGLAAVQPPWSSYIIETSELRPREVAHLVAQWLRQHIYANKTHPSASMIVSTAPASTRHPDPPAPAA